MVEPLSDEELMQRCARGDGSAFVVLAARYRPRLDASDFTHRRTKR